MNFFEILYARKNGAALPANFFDLLFAKSFTPAIEWGKYDGTLPAQYSANGSALADYRVYGSAGGVGDETDNLFDKNADDASNGYVNNAYIQIRTGNTVQSSEYFVSEYIPISKTLSNNITIYERDEYSTFAHNAFYDVNKALLYTFYNRAPSRTVDVPDNARYIRLSVKKSNTDSVMVSYQNNLISYTPFGYKLDMSVSDGTTSTTIPIYIGSDPLGEDEYVSFEEGKVYRRTENLFDGEIGLDNTIILKIDGTLAENASYALSHLIPVEPGDDYTFSFDYSGESQERAFYPGVFYKQDMSVVQMNYPLLHPVVGKNTVTLTAPRLAKYFRLQWKKPTDSNVMLVEGSTAPEQYIPYLQPTDPPVPLPALPTVDGVTITDYAGQSAAPSRFYAKYQKG